MSRLLAVASALDGMDRQTMPDWVIRFNAEGVAGLRDWAQKRSPDMARGRPVGHLESPGAARSRPRARRRQRLAGKDLCRIVEERFGVAYSENGILRLLHDLDLFWQKARPIHPAADLQAQARFKRNSQR